MRLSEKWAKCTTNNSLAASVTLVDIDMKNDLQDSELILNPHVY